MSTLTTSPSDILFGSGASAVSVKGAAGSTMTLGSAAIDMMTLNTTSNTVTVLQNFTLTGSKTVSLGSNVVTNVATPLAGTDAANKAYVDSISGSARSEERRVG